MSTLRIQKNIRAFLTRRKIVANALVERNIKLNILMNINLKDYTHEEMVSFIDDVANSSLTAQNYYLSRFVLNHIQIELFYHYCMAILQQQKNQSIRQIVFNKIEFVKILKNLLSKKQAARLLNLSASTLIQNGRLATL